ncbi:uncharacterized protein LOC116011800 [Ipomoea triloba]|uniref:uncharacterized protein LOC116011800 n=1 Tax=Ipomoea triloba TaxID=35885 RepID=UPI00125D9D83|nr:uncharacterized protein LOC116011800 [Ipomoea triloba]
MSAILCGKRSSIFSEDLQSSSAPASTSPSSPPLSKRFRCSSFSPSSSTAASFSSISSRHDYLIASFPGMDKQLLEKTLQECGDDLDSAIRSLNELHLGSGKVMSNGEVTPPKDPSTAKEHLIDSAEWVERFVQEMMISSNVDDAKARASRALEVLERSIYGHAAEAAVQCFQQENGVLKQQLEASLQENTILKRAVSIQHERQKEFDERGQEMNNLKQILAQYREQLRNLEVNNYALAMHLKQTQQSNSMPGHFNPDVF